MGKLIYWRLSLLLKAVVLSAVMISFVVAFSSCGRAGRGDVPSDGSVSVDSGYFYADDDELYVGVRRITTRDIDGERLGVFEYDGCGRLIREFVCLSDSVALLREIVRNGAGRIVRDRRFDLDGRCVGEERFAYSSSGLLKAVFRASAGDTVAYAVSRQSVTEGLFCEMEKGVSRRYSEMRDVRLKFFHSGRISQVVELVGFGESSSERRREIFERDECGRIVTDSLFVSGQLTNIKKYTYNSRGDRERCLLVMPRHEFGISDDGRLVQSVVGSDSTVWSYSYIYDDKGRWTERRQFDGSGKFKDLLYRNFD